MTNSRASKSLQLLDKHVSTGTEASYTYTPPSALDMENRYSHIIIRIHGELTAALDLEFIVNALGGTTYQYSYMLIDGTTVSGVQTTGTAHALIMPSALTGAGMGFAAEIEIWLKADGTNDNLYGRFKASADNEGHVDGTWLNTTATASTVTSIKLETSTSTWLAQTFIEIYGVLK